MSREIKKILFDVKVSIDSIEDYLQGNKDFTVYQKNKLLRRAIEREIEIIGEAINKLLKINPDLSISGARKIVDTRNWVIHAYDNVDDIILWSIITQQLPILKLEVKKLLENE